MQDKDTLRRFLFESLAIRGEWINLTESWQAAKQFHDYPDIMIQQLGEALVAVTLLSATLKFEGHLILQAQGDGQLKSLVAQSTHQREIRGWARYEATITEKNFIDLLGQGRMVLTINPSKGEPYQGIVNLSGQNLADSVENYFTQSEQLKTRLWLFANADQAAGLFIQELPTHNSQDHDQHWQRIEMLADTMTKDELFNLNCEKLLRRLFHEEALRLFKPETVQFKCRCSAEKIETTLLSLGEATVNELLAEQDNIIADCEFCSAQYRFDRIDAQRIFSQNKISNPLNTKH